MLMRRSGNSETPGMLVQRGGKQSKTTEKPAHRLPIPLIGSHPIHVYKGDSVKYIAVG